jgi:hypothetical protein
MFLSLIAAFVYGFFCFFARRRRGGVAREDGDREKGFLYIYILDGLCFSR